MNYNKTDSRKNKNSHNGYYHIVTGGDNKNGSYKYNYKNISDIDRTIKYISRTSGTKSPEDLICYGAINANSRCVTDTIKDFRMTHNYSQNAEGYRYLYHELYYFADILIPYIESNEVNLPKLARELATKIATDGDNNHHYQVAYAIHSKNNTEKYHIHFIVNSVDIATHKKRRNDKENVKRLEKILNNTVKDYIWDELLL